MSRTRRGFLLSALSLALLACVSHPSAAQDAQELRSLQQRLTDAKCYGGPIDGVMSAAVGDAIRRCPDTAPVLTIETGMHVSAINRIATDQNCRLAVTAGDKVARLWSLPAGTLQRTLRVPIGSEDNGKIYSVAISPDGSTVAAGGWDATYERGRTMGIYLFDASTGAMTHHFGAAASVISHLAFSPDGRYIATVLGIGQGLRVFDVRSGNEVASDRNYTKDAYGLAFAPDGRLFTSSLDGYLRSYDRNFRLRSRVATTAGRPYGIAVDATGEKLAVGFADSTSIEIRRTSDLGLAYTADSRGIDGRNVGAVAWSRDGNRLIAGGIYVKPSGAPVVTWENAGRGSRSEVDVAHNSIMDIKACGDGVAVAAADPGWVLLDAAGQVTQRKFSAAAEMRGKRGDGFEISGDGTKVRFGLEFGAEQPVLFDLVNGTLTADARIDGLTAPKTDGIAVTDWGDRYDPKLGGRPIPLPENEISRALAVAPDESRFVLGTGWNVRVYDRNGKLQWLRSVVGNTGGVSVTADGRLVVAAEVDGTIRWYRMSDGVELLALFVDKEDRRWVAWTPSGYYQASPGGEDLFGWHVNRGWDQAADFFPASRFRDRFSRPDIVQKILVTLDEGKAIEEANREANLRTDNSSVASRLPPVVRILSPVTGSTVNGGEVTLEYELRSPSGLPVDTVEVQIDGRPTRGFERVTSGINGTLVERRTIAIPAKDVQIGLVARSGALASDVASIQLKWAGSANGDDLLKPKLYGVVVGISTYQDPSINLHYAAKDARDFAEALKAQQGGMYREVELKVLTDAQATTAEIKRSLTWLERSVTSRDVGLVFLAGHGVTDSKNRYYYLTADSDYRQPEDTALEGLILRDRTRSVAGKVLVFLDTCHAGAAMVTTRGATDINATVSELSSTENGVVTFASSTGRQLSQENDSWHNGAFTKALIEGLPATDHAGKADIAHKGVITTATLDFWLAERVKELTGGSQSPVMSRPPTIPDFPLFAAVR